jgi:hypothetical protein
MTGSGADDNEVDSPELAGESIEDGCGIVAGNIHVTYKRFDAECFPNCLEPIQPASHQPESPALTV